MNVTRRALLFGLLAVGGVSSSRAAPPPQTRAEIAYLLDFVDHSGCAFFRNGTWYEPQRARAHLQSKYEFLVARGGVGSAEEFIARAATTSSISGQPYQVRCADGASHPSGPWLRGVLEEYRLQRAPR